MKPDPAIVALRDEIDELREKVRQLNSGIVPVWAGLQVTGSERVVLTALANASGICSHDHLLDRLQARTKSESELSPKTVDVHICRLRKKLKSLSPPIGITTAYGDGYWMDADSRARLEARRVKNEGNSQ